MRSRSPETPLLSAALKNARTYTHTHQNYRTPPSGTEGWMAGTSWAGSGRAALQAGAAKVAGGFLQSGRRLSTYKHQSHLPEARHAMRHRPAPHARDGRAFGRRRTPAERSRPADRRGQRAEKLEAAPRRKPYPPPALALPLSPCSADPCRHAILLESEVARPEPGDGRGLCGVKCGTWESSFSVEQCHRPQFNSLL